MRTLNKFQETTPFIQITEIAKTKETINQINQKELEYLIDESPLVFLRCSFDRSFRRLGNTIYVSSAQSAQEVGRG